MLISWFIIIMKDNLRLADIGVFEKCVHVQFYQGNMAVYVVFQVNKVLLLFGHLICK